METVAEKLLQLRKNKGVSREDLAEVIGVSVSAVAMYEIGERIPRDDIKIKLAEYFDTTVGSLFFNQDSHE